MTRPLIAVLALVFSLGVVLFEAAMPELHGGIRARVDGGYACAKGGYAGWIVENRLWWATDMYLAQFGEAFDPGVTEAEERLPGVGRIAEFKGGDGGVMRGYRLVRCGWPFPMLMAELVVSTTHNDAGKRRYEYTIVGGREVQHIQVIHPDWTWRSSIIPTKIIWVGACANLLAWWVVWVGVGLAASTVIRGVRGVYWAREGRCRWCGYPSTDQAARCPECGRAWR